MANNAQNKSGIFLCVAFCLCFTSSFAQTVNDLRPTVTMKEYVDMQAELNKEWMQKLVDVQMQNINDNVNKANATMDKKFESVNEFRNQLKDQAASFVTWQALIGLVIGVSGFLFGYANYKKNNDPAKSSGSFIRSGDNVEVKK